MKEYKTFQEQIGISIADYLGLKYEQREESDNLIAIST
jgi:hypothetical protein